MKTDTHIDKGCDLGIEMMAYIYGELADPDKSRVDSHLSDCASCTDEFAEISIARFSVYEWKREEFDPIETPSFVIPIEPAVEAEGWFAGLRGIFAGWTPTAAFASAAAVLVVAGMIGYQSLPGREIANVESPVEMDSPVIAPGSEESLPIQDVTRLASRSEVPNLSARRVVVARPVQARATVRKTERVKENPSRAVNRRSEPQKPNLSNFQDDEDMTLRLSDLFAEGGV